MLHEHLNRYSVSLILVLDLNKKHMNKEAIYEKVVQIISDYLKLEENEISNDSHMVNDVGIDSLALVELGFKFSEAFSIPMLQPTEDNMVIGNLVCTIDELMNKN